MGARTEDYIGRAEAALLHTYHRYPVVLERGEGVYLYDVEGKKYLDFGSGIGVFALGYGNLAWRQTLHDQIDRLTHTSNYFYSAPAVEAAELLLEASGMDRVFFTNSGSEAVEGAIKTARKYAYLKDGEKDHEMISMGSSFHGRTMGALSVTGNSAYREPFEPGIGLIRFAALNDFASVMSCVNEKTCAILLETVQGEGGVHPASEDFLRKIRALCDERGLLLILDEIQCGMGRTGELFAWQRFGIKPDIMTCAKALGCGVPVGAFLTTEAVAENSLKPGDHGSTYGGNPLACAAVAAVLREYGRQNVLQNVQTVGVYLEQELDRLAAAGGIVRERRGRGLMQGLELSVPASDVISRAMEKGLILFSAGKNVIRFLPPLVIGKQHVDEMMEILTWALKASQ